MVLPCDRLVGEVRQQRHAYVLHCVRLILQHIQRRRQVEVEGKLKVVLMYADEWCLDFCQASLQCESLAVPAIQDNEASSSGQMTTFQQVLQVLEVLFITYC